LIKIEEEYGKRYERIQQRPTLRARRRAYVQLDRKISAACERLAQSRISVKEFLLYTGHLAYDAGMNYTISKRNKKIISYFQVNLNKKKSSFWATYNIYIKKLYFIERRRGVRNVEVHNGIVPPQILETIEGK